VLTGQGMSVGIYLGGLLTLGTLMGVNGIAIALVMSSTGQAIFYIISAQYLKNQEKNKSN
jgi:Na+-driven multidrug efflux pump